MRTLNAATSRISAILLTAGESTRMGRQKALLPWCGTTLLQYQVNALLGAGVSQVVVVLGYRAETLRPLVESVPGVETALNLRYRTGKSSSVRAGLRHVDPQAEDIMVLAADQPRSPETVGRVLIAHQELGSLITYPTYRGKGGHPVIFSRVLLHEMTRIRESRQGLREVVQRHHSRASRIEMDDADVLLDLNDPEDYRQATTAKGQ